MRRLLKDNDGFGYMIVFVVVLMIIFAMLFAGSYIMGEISKRTDVTDTSTENFIVDDPSVNKNCNLGHDVLDVLTVQYHNGTGWKTLGAGDYTVTGNTVTVNAAAMN